MRSYINLFIGFFIAALICVPFNYGRANEVNLPDNLNEVSLFKISDQVYVVHGIQSLPDKHNKGLISNTGIVLTNVGAVIVDSGGGLEVGRLIVRKVRKLTDKPIIAVFNTHIHGDHWLGNAAIREAFPNARIYAHEIAIERLKNGEADRWLDIFTKMSGKDAVGTMPVLPNVGLKGGETIDIHGTAFKTHHTGHAHTDSDIMVEVPTERLLFTGDIVEHGRAVSSDVPQDFNAKGQIEAIKYALTLPVDTFIPGHGVTGGREIPQAALRYLETLYDSVKRHYNAGLMDFEMKEKVVNDM